MWVALQQLRNRDRRLWNGLNCGDDTVRGARARRRRDLEVLSERGRGHGARLEAQDVGWIRDVVAEVRWASARWEGFTGAQHPVDWQSSGASESFLAGGEC
jgi:hypothetical protein